MWKWQYFSKLIVEIFIQILRIWELEYIKYIYKYLAKFLIIFFKILEFLIIYEFKKNIGYSKINGLMNFFYKNTLIQVNDSLDIYFQLPVSKKW